MKFEFNNTAKMNGLIIDGAASAGEAESQPKPQPQPEAVEQVVQESQEPQQNGLVVQAEPMDSASTEVAVRQNTGVAASTEAQQFTAGGEDVDVSELGHGAYPKLKIENGEFDLDGQSAGKVMVVSVANRRLQRLIKPAGVSDPTSEQMAYYTVVPGINPDNLTTTRGVKVSDFKQSLKEDGLKPEEVEYEMVGVQILKLAKDVGDIVPVGTMAEMQIPQASMQRFRGLMYGAKKANIPMGQRVLKVSVGPKTQGKGGTYNPWVIDPVNGTTDQVCEQLGIDLSSSGGIEISDLDF